MSNSTPAAWLHIGPLDDPASDAAPIGVQRHFTVEPDYPRLFALNALVSDVASAVFAITGQQDDHDRVADAVRMRTNVAVSLGGGMYATIYPSDAGSGVNISRAAPLDFDADSDSASGER